MILDDFEWLAKFLVHKQRRCCLRP